MYVPNTEHLKQGQEPRRLTKNEHTEASEPAMTVEIEVVVPED
jgi:hypothetical protein